MKEMKRKICLVLTVLMLASTLFVGCDKTLPEDTPVGENTPADEPSAEELPDATKMTYDAALSCLEKGEIEEAYALFLSIPDYRDVSEHLERFVYRYGKKVTRTSTDTSISYYQYNPYGQETEWILGNNVRTQSYDEKGNLVSVIYFDGGRHFHTYDERGLLVRRVYENEQTGKRDTIEEHTYNELGQKIEVCTVRDGVTVAKEHYEYDEAGNRTKTSRFYANNGEEPYQIIESAYDAAGNRISHKETYYDGQWCEWQYAYNENHLVICEQYSDYIGDDWQYDMAYDVYGQVIRRSYTSASKSYDYDYENEYDDEGHLVRCAAKNGERIFHVENYEYDAKGNLTRQSVYDYKKNGEAISYYIEEYLDYQLYYDPFYPHNTIEDPYGGK